MNLKHIIADFTQVDVEDSVFFWRSIFSDAIRTLDMNMVHDDLNKDGPDNGSRGYIALTGGGVTLSHDPTEGRVIIIIHAWGDLDPDKLVNFLYDVLSPKFNTGKITRF
jgi:hypothetical protein